jgi:hypothetical protein
MSEGAVTKLKIEHALRKGDPIKNIFDTEIGFVQFIRESLTTFSKWESAYKQLTTNSGKKALIEYLTSSINDGQIRAKGSIIKFIHAEFGDDVFIKKQTNSIISAWFLSTVYKTFFTNVSDLKRFKITDKIWFTTKPNLTLNIDNLSYFDTIEKLVQYNLPLVLSGTITSQKQCSRMYNLLVKYGVKHNERCPAKREILERLVLSLMKHDFFEYTEEEIDDIVMNIYSWNKAEAKMLISKFKKDRTEHFYTLLKL